MENHIYQCNRTLDSGVHLGKHFDSLTANLEHVKERQTTFRIVNFPCFKSTNNNSKLIIKPVALFSAKNPDFSKVLYLFGVIGKKVDEKLTHDQIKQRN